MLPVGFYEWKLATAHPVRTIMFKNILRLKSSKYFISKRTKRGGGISETIKPGKSKSWFTCKQKEKKCKSDPLKG